MIVIYSRGVFVIPSKNIEDHKKVMEEGPWFKGRFGLFFKPWVLDFN